MIGTIIKCRFHTKHWIAKLHTGIHLLATAFLYSSMKFFWHNTAMNFFNKLKVIIQPKLFNS